MRACFLGRNVCALGFGVGMVQTLPLTEEAHPRDADPSAPPDGLPDVGGASAGPYIHRKFWAVSDGDPENNALSGPLPASRKRRY
jgi:hypothetical protein